MVPIEGAVNHSDMEPEDQSLRERFNRIADATTVALGSLPALVGSVLIVIVWALTGPLFNFSDTWQLFINTTTTVVTFWIKLDEIIRVLGGARNEFITLDHAPEDVLVEHEKELVDLANDHPETNVLPGEPQPAGKTTSS
jgi:low affinity Fe/Cu permease